MSSSILDRKIDYWEHQLLDLGKRNKMINYRETKRATLKITEPSLSDLFHRLAVKEEKLTFQRAIDKETDIRVFSILSLLESLSSPLPVTVGDIGTESSVMERQKTLKHLRSKSRLALEEQGTNILYLSFGFIEWKDGKGASAKWIKSPLVLVPVVLSLESLNSPYTLEKHEDDIVVNPTLDYYLNTEYGIDLPEFDENKESIDEFLIKMEEIADMRGWRILPEVSLGLLSFLKITMYNDLLVNEERIRKHPVIRAIAGEAEEVNQIPEELIDFDLDSIGVQDCFQVMSADSSQQDAILYSKNNVSFVMQGPPGTGKSQTITNIIAEALADGKKVLFVSEKMAALQVVYRRLHEAHLGEFCLPLHSYKANKKEILEQIGANLKLKQTRVKDTARNSLDNLQSIRDEINAYAKELHQVIEPLNMSCYEVYGKLDEVGASPSISFALDKTASLSQTNLNHLLGLLKKYSLAVSGLNYYIKNNPWDGIRICSIGYDEKQKMALCLSDAINFLAHCTEQLDSIKECEHMASALTYKQLPDFCHDLLTVTSLPKIPSEWLRYENTDVISTKAITASGRYKNMKELREQISVVFNEAIFSFDYNGWKISVTDMLALIENIGFLGHNDYNFVYENAEILSSQVKAFFDEVTVFENNISKAESLLGTQLSRNTTCFGFLNSLLLLTKDNSFLPKEWVLGDVTKLKQTTVSAKTLSAEIKAIGQCINQITQYYEQVKLFSYSFIDPTKVSESLFVDIDSEHLIFDSINAVCTEIPTIPEPFAYLKSERKQTDVVFYNTIFSLDYIEWVNNAFDYFSQIEGVGLLNPANRDIIFENAQRFIVQVRLLSDEVSAFEKNLSEIDTLLETKLSRDLAGIDFSRELYASIKDNTPLPNEWLSGDIVKVKATAFDARTLASEIISIEHDILQSWEKDILTFDYLPILQRFKTDYTSILKVFNHQYRADKKSIQVLSVNVIKKLTDESALEILNQLKDYHEKLNLFNENSSEYSNVLGERFSGINSDWDGIFRIIATCINVQNLFNGKVPHKIANNLSGDHNTLIEKILSLTKTSESALRNARSIVERNQFNINFNAADIDTMNVIANADKIIVLLDKLSAQKEVIQGYLKDKETDYETIVQSIKSLEECNRLLSVIKNEEQKFINANCNSKLQQIFKSIVDRREFFERGA